MIVAISKKKDGGALNYCGGTGDGEEQRLLGDINKESTDNTQQGRL